MKWPQTTSFPLSPARRWTALFCLLLVGIAIGAEAIHSHPDNLASPARHCTACQIAHAPAQVAPVALLDTVFIGASVLVPEESPDPQQGVDAFALFSRPPPEIE